MLFYHGTTESIWQEIQKEGFLWGRKNKYWCGQLMSRCTWLAKDKENAGIYDEHGLTDTPFILLEVNLPDVEQWHDWQICYYNPIPLLNIKKVEK